ncbi:DUF3566 domain-containing protein [Ornithinimicrobium faecis]|uniref:DUF3566 domain-containing protein n=1 Tax=Ornithinimicrobium faecis TaxID=2934158 RepID=A0ABY4YTM9_9MICO|nr:MULTISPECIES: DUF3566 domain-containing protein [unclassified Ornithinimicrobium]USQ80093.1 DUF3566 domain-containing protein [Ornithinimicrobium sp. HY1793]
MSTTGQGTSTGGSGSAARRSGDDDTQKIRRPGTQTGQGSGMRDGAMARTAPRRDLGAAAARARGTGAQSARPGGSAGARPQRRTGPRRVRLTLQRVDPWSVMKISFLVSVALGVATVIMVAVLWTVLNGMNVFSTVNELIVEITTGETSASAFNLMDYIGFGRVVSLSVVIGVINVILLTALATLTAFLYNVCTALVGGAQLTLSDE